MSQLFTASPLRAAALAALCVAGGIAVLIMGRQARRAQLHEKQVTH